MRVNGRGRPRFARAVALGFTRIPIVRLPVDDVDRRMLRQVLNKLKGEHMPELDALEYRKIVDAGREEELMELIAISEEDLLDILQEDDSDTDLTSDESAEEDDEKPEEYMRCPKCGYEFNPEHFKVDSTGGA